MRPRVHMFGPREGDEVIPGPNAMRIVEDGTHTEQRLGVGVITMAPRTDGPPPHWHRRHDEGFYVVAGTPRFTDETGAGRDAPAGTWIIVPRGAAHSFANPGEDEAVILNTFTPAFYVEYFREARRLADSDGPLSSDAVADLRERYWTYAAGARPQTNDERATS